MEFNIPRRQLFALHPGAAAADALEDATIRARVYLNNMIGAENEMDSKIC
jgi:hypothetical protein